MLQKIGVDFSVATKPEDVDGSSHIILPGVGSFDSGAAKLRARGLDLAIRSAADNPETKILGICLGMQLLFEKSEEGSASGLQLIPGSVIKFRSANAEFKIPHMGWNQAYQVQPSDIFDGVFDGARFYFVHSYHVLCSDEWVICYADHGCKFPAVVARGNIYGTQFHPEKSHRFGLELLKRFVRTPNGK
jgi:glutamine amidotransferase